MRACDNCTVLVYGKLCEKCARKLYKCMECDKNPYHDGLLWCDDCLDDSAKMC